MLVWMSDPFEMEMWKEHINEPQPNKAKISQAMVEEENAAISQRHVFSVSKTDSHSTH